MLKVNKCIMEKHIDHNKVRAYCIKQGLYECGTNKEYSAMLNNCLSAETESEILDICEDIWNHTSEEYKEDLEDCGGNYNDFVSGLINECVYFTVNYDID